MAMDINDFGLEHEAFGFGDSNYSQMANSNTEFLNLFGSGDSPKAKSLKKDYYARIDALPASDTAGKNALFAELESKLAALNASKSEIDEVANAKKKAERGEKLVGGLGKALDIFTRTTDALGIGKDLSAGGAGGGQGQGQGQGGGGGSRVDNKVPTWVWITGGVVVLGLGIFAIYKFRR